MKTFLAVAVGALALMGCGPLDQSELEGQVAQAVEQRPEVGKGGGDPPRAAPQELPDADHEQLYAPERPTFLNSFIYQTGINPDGSPVKP